MKNTGVSRVFCKEFENGFAVILDLNFYVVRVIHEGKNPEVYRFDSDTPMSEVSVILNRVENQKKIER